MVLVTPLILKSTKGMLEMQRLAPEMRKLQTRAQERPPEAQRRDDEALPGAQGQPDGLVSAAGGPDAGLHHHVPHPARLDVRARRAATNSSPGPCWPPAAAIRPPRSGSCRATCRQNSELYQSLVRQDSHVGVRARPVAVAGRDARPGLRPRPGLRRSGRGARRCCTSSSSGWSPPVPRSARRCRPASRS